jgi:hypothetical protein
MRHTLLAGFAAFALVAVAAAPLAVQRQAEAEGTHSVTVAKAEGTHSATVAEAEGTHSVTVAEAEGIRPGVAA